MGLGTRVAAANAASCGRFERLCVFDSLELERGRAWAPRTALLSFRATMVVGEKRPLHDSSIPGRLVPAFSVHTYFAPGDESLTVERLRSHLPACARSSAPIVSIHTLLWSSVGSQYSNTFGYPLSGPFAARTRLVDTSILVHKTQGKTHNSFLNDLHRSACVFQKYQKPEPYMLS